jgi:hypothetical protein
MQFCICRLALNSGVSGKFSLIWIIAGRAILPMLLNGDDPPGDQTDGAENGGGPTKVNPTMTSSVTPRKMT